MSIPQICPSCGNHVSGPHAKDCCFGTPEYAHIGWPNVSPPMASDALIYGTVGTVTWSKPVDFSSWVCPDNSPETASAIRRLLDYLNDEPEEEVPPKVQPGLSQFAFTAHAIFLLTKRCEELRKEAASISLVESRAKRSFAVGILEGLIEELNAA